MLRKKIEKNKFYFLLLKDDKRNGVLFAPEKVDTRFGEAAYPATNYEDLIFELRKGRYNAFMSSNVTAHFANEELKQLIEENIPKDYPLEFLPVKTKSIEHGDKLYYIIHFTKIFDVIDKKNSVRLSTGSIVKPCIKYEKAKDLDFFNSTAYSDGFIVSDKFRKLMKEKALDTGIEFWEWKSI